MVVVQLVEWLLPTPEVRCSNPMVGNTAHYLHTVNCIKSDENKEKEARNGPYIRSGASIVIFDRTLSLWNWQLLFVSLGKSVLTILLRLLNKLIRT